MAYRYIIVFSFRFEGEIFGINCPSYNNTNDSYNKINNQYYNFQPPPLNMEFTKEIDSLLLQNQYTPTLISK